MPVTINDVLILNVLTQDKRNAHRLSMRKFQHISDTFERFRTPPQRFIRSKQGDIAKLTVKRYLENQGLPVTDWDTIRTNWRTSRKPYDLLVNDHNIEVRSSISKYLTIQEVINEEHIIHPPRVNFKEVNLQVFFPDTNCNTLWVFGWALGSNISNRRYFTYRHLGYPVPFHMMPFSDTNARTMNQLLTYLTT
jgi:hypothetical protein